ncbi:MAG: GNAT family N-acetyltransferase [Bacteroidetes bacterium]|nr:GNAT family N-acetyltransferase [Bacteroidota bacterium]
MIFIEGKRLLLRRLKLSDYNDFFHYRSNQDVCRYQGFDPFSRKEAKAFIRQHMDKPLGVTGEWTQIGIVLKENLKLIGDCAVHFKKNEPKIVEMGITLSLEFRGRGYAKECIELLMDHLSSNFDLHKIVALLDARNEQALHLVEHLGFKKEGHFRKSYFDKIDQDWVDEVFYGKLMDQG